MERSATTTRGRPYDEVPRRHITLFDATHEDVVTDANGRVDYGGAMEWTESGWVRERGSVCPGQ